MTAHRLAAAALAAVLGLSALGSAGARHHEAYSVYSRVSCFNDYGVEYSGNVTTWGRSAGASWDIPLGSLVIFPGGETRVIEDRGNTPWGDGTVDAPSWIDAFSPDCTVSPPSWPVSEYGDYTFVTVIPPE